jgi:prepilin-type processing-associated H-X9-DG protein
MELLIVIAVISILAAMLLPALSRSRSRAHAIFCLSNNKQLVVAWEMYSSDNNDQLVYNLGGNAQTRGFAPRDEPNWVNNIMDWELNPDNTNSAFAKTSMLGVYAGFSTTIYKCPADRALSDAQRNAGWESRIRSISMNAMVGNPGALLQNGVNVNNPYYRQYLKESEIRNPAMTFIFLDEHPDSINDGYFVNINGTNQVDDINSTNQLEWIDLPASYHNGGGSFSFADGHSEIHRWVNETTKRPAVEDGARLPVAIRSTERADFDWVIQRMSVERYSSIPRYYPH